MKKKSDIPKQNKTELYRQVQEKSKPIRRITTNIGTNVCKEGQQQKNWKLNLFS